MAPLSETEIERVLGEPAWAALLDEDALWGPENSWGYITADPTPDLWARVLGSRGWDGLPGWSPVAGLVEDPSAGYLRIAAPSSDQQFLPNLIQGPIGRVSQANEPKYGIEVSHASTVSAAEQFATLEYLAGSMTVHPVTTTDVGVSVGDWLEVERWATAAAAGFRSARSKYLRTDRRIPRAVRLLEWPEAYATVAGIQVIRVQGYGPSDPHTRFVLDRTCMTIWV